MGKKYFESLVHDNKTGDTVSAVLIGHLGYLPFTWENWKFQLENQMVRAIPLGKLQKIWAVI